MTTEKCPGCGGRFSGIEGMTHSYMDAAPGCWSVFGELLARELADPACYDVHYLTIDAYAAQHPGKATKKGVQSMALHLVRLCAQLEFELVPLDANRAMQQAGAHREKFVWLEPPANRGTLTVADVRDARSASEYTRLVKAWGSEVWQAWAAHHATIRQWLVADGGTVSGDHASTQERGNPAAD